MADAYDYHETEEDGVEPVFSGDEFYSLFRQARTFILISCTIVGIAVFALEREEVLSSPTFSSSTDISILPGELQIDYARRALAGARDGQISAISRTVSETLESDEVLAEAANRVAATTAPEVLEMMEPSTSGGSPFDRLLAWINYGILPEGPVDPLAHYRDAVDAEIIDGAFILQVSVTTPDAQLSADLANALVAVYNESDAATLAEAKAIALSDLETRLETAETELRALSERESELEAQAAGATDQAATQLAAERRTNVRLQEAQTNIIANLTTEVANIEVASGGFAPQARVLRSAMVSTVPDGPTPLAKGLAYAAGLFIFFIGYLIFVSLMRTILRPEAHH